MSDTETFAMRLKTRRIAIGMTQQELARWAGRDVETVYRYENGLIVPRLDTAIQMAAILGVRLADLIGDDASVNE